jgi:hypothetical protein
MLPATLPAQQRELDRGVFLVRRGSDILGREEFVLRSGGSAGGIGRYTLRTTAWYPADRPERALTVILEFGPDSQPMTARFEGGNGDQRRVFLALGPRRMTVRRATPQGESAREYPVRGRQHLVSDSVFALHALLPRAGSARHISVDGTRGPVTRIEHLGVDQTPMAGDSRQLTHVRLTSERDTRDLWYDERGRIMKISIPDRGVVVERVLEPED